MSPGCNSAAAARRTPAECPTGGASRDRGRWCAGLRRIPRPTTQRCTPFQPEADRSVAEDDGFSPDSWLLALFHSGPAGGQQQPVNRSCSRRTIRGSSSTRSLPSRPSPTGATAARPVRMPVALSFPVVVAGLAAGSGPVTGSAAGDAGSARQNRIRRNRLGAGVGTASGFVGAGVGAPCCFLPRRFGTTRRPGAIPRPRAARSARG